MTDRQPTVQLASVRRTVIYTYDVSGAPPIQKRYAKTIRIKPDQLRATFVDGEMTGLRISGPRVLKSRLGDREEEVYYSYHLNEQDFPEWARPYLAEPKSRPVALVTTFDAARILEGHVLGCQTQHVDAATGAVTHESTTLVRLYRPEELLEANRQARAEIPNPPPPMTHEQAVALTRPLPEA